MKLAARFGFFAALALTLAASVAAAAPRTMTFDKAHSEVGFSIRHFFSKVNGRFERYDGTIVYDDQNLAASTVNVAIQDSSINTQNERRDNHLRSADFFEVDKYPDITFKSSKVVPGKDKSHFKVDGALTMHGVTKPVTLDVEFLGIAAIGMGGNSMGTRAGFAATTTISRKDFGIVWNKTLDNGSVMLGDDVTITLNVEAVEKQPQPN
jgi:polyisoprenoid-binding protein YceI